MTYSIRMQDSNSQSSPYQYDTIFNGLPGQFNEKALELFKFQYKENAFYKNYADRFGASPATVHDLKQIPFLPVSFFKTGMIETGKFEPEIIFESSGTTGQSAARHFVKYLDLYRESFVKGFEFFYGKIEDYCVLGLLPAYLERKGSSLVWMVEEWMRISRQPENGFYLYDFEKLRDVLLKLESRKQRTLLIGVSFALLDFAEKYSMQLSHTIVMETGGMKGRREEITREELHQVLKEKLGVTRIHSEYGMTELLSQAYSMGEGKYQPVPWMKMLLREEDDPLTLHSSGDGLLNIIDLANRYSCAFIATDDVAKLSEDGSFEILGRIDNSDIRGCSLLVV
ncbi:MAG TPA: acyl transferase [Puia sp.]|nr:acyl transferase [Puia sp.]